MKITSINQEIYTKLEKFANILPKIDIEKESKNIINHNIDSYIEIINHNPTEIINQTLNNLVNNLQSDNNHPLSKPQNAPIENFNEALSILNNINSHQLKSTGLQAQANISATDLLQIFND